MEKQDSYFEFSFFELDEERRKILFYYKTGRENGEILNFTETISLPSPIPDTISSELLNLILQNLHLILGISYWKLFCPKDIRINSFLLSKEQADFWNTVYTKGLGEFFYTNKLNSDGMVNFPYSENVNVMPVNFERQNRSFVGIGGGKDSLVSLELLKENSKQITAFVLETQKPYQLINELLNIIGVDSLTIKRELDSKLFDANKSGNAYNGHVPISAIYAFVGFLAAIVYDYRYVIVSNEKSASVGNVEYNGQTVNHQWSKSEEFEKLFQKYIENFITPDVHYFSLIRPFSEIKVTKLFSKYGKYFKIFSSCNTNFKIQRDGVSQKWCGRCAKCAFMFSMLSAFLPKEKVVEIFGKNLFTDESLVQIYRDLLGVGNMKPFDCVGTFEENIAAFNLTHDKKEFEDDVVMKMFMNEILPKVNVTNDVFTNGESSLIPDEFKQVVIRHSGEE